MRILVNISYDGLYFIGSQKQKEGRTIQGEFESLLSNLFQEEIKVIICSRLDAKVSAKNFVFVFDTKNKANISLVKIKRYLQDSFNSEVLIKEIQIVDKDFHPRHHVKYKIYSYRIENTPLFNPLTSSHSLVVIQPLNLREIKRGIKLFVGLHDFKFFSSDIEEKNTSIKIEKVWVKKRKNFVYLNFKGKSFLKYQIRFLVGALILLSQNRITKENIVNALNGIQDPGYKKKKAEPQGLVLEKIVFEGVKLCIK